MTKKLRKGAFCTDIHFGKKSNSPQHNEDCLNYLDWFLDQVRAEGDVDYLAFLGDWNENRSSINLQTLNFSYLGAKKLNEFGLPVYFVVGNHDLYHRHTREVYSVLPFAEFSNFQIIDEPIVIKEIADGVLFSPYLFHEEYTELAEYLALPFWAGHFEFKGFRVTGHNVLMPHGPDPALFVGPTDIISGHFHQRQTQNNITFMGNTFPMDFGDAGDFKRGMMVYDHVTQKRKFRDWAECPKYLNTRLSRLLDGSVTLPHDGRIKCMIDEEISLEESNALRDTFIKKYNLREFTMQETTAEELSEALRETETDVSIDDTNIDTTNLHTVDDLVVSMLGDIKADTIDNALLIEEYRALHD